MIYKCRLCGKDFEAASFTIADLGIHVSDHKQKLVLPHDAIKEFVRI